MAQRCLGSLIFKPLHPFCQYWTVQMSQVQARFPSLHDLEFQTVFLSQSFPGFTELA